MEMWSIGRRVASFARALATLVFVAVVLPLALASAGEWRFGGRQPLHGVAPPTDWRVEQARSLLTEQLSQRTIADLTIRVCLVTAWLAAIVFVLTVAVETVHMLRHGGHHMPDVRGLQWSQRGARVIASGLLALLPLVQSAGPVSARYSLVPVASQTVIAPTLGSWLVDAQPVRAPVSAQPGGSMVSATGEYVVAPGDSVYAIAARLAGDDPAAVARLADRIVDVNLGREMGNGDRFTNAAHIDVGWVLQIPAETTDGAVAQSDDVSREHLVEPGETLWSIAGDELGDPHLWPELYDANSGRRFEDGRVFDDPSIVQPGWLLHVPASTPDDTAPSTPAPEPAVESAPEPVAPLIPRPTADPAVVADQVGQADQADHDAHHRDDTMIAPAIVADAVDEQAEAASPAQVAVVGRPENVWQADRAASAGAPDQADADSAAVDAERAPALITVRRAAMLGTGILTLLAVRRRRRLRSAPSTARLPEPAPGSRSIERAVRAGDLGGRLARVDLSVRAATMSLVAGGERVLAVRCAVDGEVELQCTGPVVLSWPWVGSGDRWTMPPSVPIESLAEDARQVGVPCPALVQLGVDEHGADVYVDLEALGAIEIGGRAEQAEAVVAAVAATLASSVLAETTTLVSVAVPDDAFLGHRLHRSADDPVAAMRIAQEAIGPVDSMESPIFELRARGTAGEPWSPAVVLIGAGVDAVRVPAGRAGVALVSASPIEGPSSRMEPDGELWVLRPAGVRLRPIGLVPDDISTIGELVAVGQPIIDEVIPDSPDDTIYTCDELPDDVPLAVHASSSTPAPAEPDWDLVVRLFGPVEVVDRNGERASFERSKTTELVAWLATHRDRSTRSNARTALWEQDVRDATFANVVSEARRALARLVPPPAGDEWVGRTLNEQLPLHPRVMTDAELLERALATARHDSTPQAIGALRTAVEAVGGLPFEGTSYLWPDPEGLTSRLVLLATSAAAELAAHCLSIGDVEGVFEATGRGLRVLPGHEELIGYRMRAHAQAGDHAGVRQEWNSYERVINADAWSDGEPSPKLVHLRKQLLNPSL